MIHSDAIVTDSGNFVARIQPFQAGGYELICSRLDLPGISRRLDIERKTGKRVESDGRNPEDKERSLKRSCKVFRHNIKSKGCDRMMTLSVSDTSPLADDRKAFLYAFKLLIRSIVKAERRFVEYEAVFERQKNGSLHIHAAVAGYFDVVRANKVWRRLTRSPNGCDVRFKKNMSDFNRRSGLAKYLSKYLRKDMEDVGFNKKRHFGSKHVLPEQRQIILKAVSIEQSAIELCEFLGLDLDAFNKFIYSFPDGGGFWFNFDDRCAKPPPF